MLDQLLVEAAAEAGTEVREGFTVQQILIEQGRVVGIRGRSRDGRTVTEHASVVIGADGVHSLLAQTMRPAQYNDRPRQLCGYYAYWSGLPMGGRFDTYVRPARGFAAVPTNDDLTVVIAGWPYAEFAANKANLERNYLTTFDLAPDFADRLRGATRESNRRYWGANYFRTPFGPGWALIGDAGYSRDFITAQGITDAFRDAELCATAVHKPYPAPAVSRRP